MHRGKLKGGGHPLRLPVLICPVGLCNGGRLRLAGCHWGPFAPTPSFQPHLGSTHDSCVLVDVYTAVMCWSFRVVAPDVSNPESGLRINRKARYFKGNLIRASYVAIHTLFPPPRAST